MGELSQRAQYAKGGLGRWYWDYRDRAVFSEIGDSKVILDLGCGEGITLAKINKEFPDRFILGVEKDDNKVRMCEYFNLPAKYGNAYALPMNDGIFDCCLFLEVIEHLDRPLAALKEINRVLTPGGKLLVLFPHDSIFKAARIASFKFKEAFADSGHVWKWKPIQMICELWLAGFTVEKTVFLPVRWPWLHCLMVARKNG